VPEIFLHLCLFLLEQRKLSVENRWLRVVRAKRGGMTPHKKGGSNNRDLRTKLCSMQRRRRSLIVCNIPSRTAAPAPSHTPALITPTTPVAEGGWGAAERRICILDIRANNTSYASRFILPN